MVFEKLRQMIAKELNVPESKITMDTHFVDDLGADSLDAIELVMAIESEFGISVSDEEAQTIQRVSDIVKIIESKK
ncbi:MAG: acyl carrier protein [Coprobacillus sp. 28_7]|nr:MAG: acyl carrier protein [Coprobacillus sp. 28_7]CCY07823.1 acyl carrier protein [Coprobacillus sp. CAG:698]